MKLFYTLILCILSSSVLEAQSWTFQAPMMNFRGQHAVVAHPNGKAYVFGGYSGSSPITSLEIYTATTNTWTSGASLPSAVRGHSFALGPDSNIYCFTGTLSSYSPACYKYSVASNTWTTIANIPTPCWESSAATVNGKIYVIGGENALALVQIYNPSNDTWSSGAPVPTPVQQHTCVAANGKIYVMGGYNNVFYDLVQIYDPVSNSWTTGANMPAMRNQFAGMLGVNGKIYAVGGKLDYGNNSSPFFATTFIYDPVANSWTTGPNMPKGLGETEGCAIGNSMFIFGGADSSGIFSNVVLRLDLVPTGTSELKSELINVYPNPADDQLFIHFNDVVSVQLNIFDVAGKIVIGKQVEKNGNDVEPFDISMLSPGIYFVNITSSTVNVTKKVVVQ